MDSPSPDLGGGGMRDQVVTRRRLTGAVMQLEGRVMGRDSSDGTGEEGKYRNRWRQMIAQEENEITTRAGKVKSP